MAKIEKGVPMPNRASGGRPPKYPWQELGLGDSFILDTPNMKTASAHCSAASIRYGKRFVARLHKNNIRVWRTQ